MLHLTKLAVGVRSIGQLQLGQAARAQDPAGLRHRTRNMPRRGDDILNGGSIYWVIAGAMLVRQRITGIVEDRWEDGSRCAGLMLDPALVRVEGRPVRAFQGWRYLAADDAPADIGEDGPHGAALSATLQRDLRALCLI